MLLFEAPANYLDDGLLLIGRHFIIARQTNAALKNISAAVYYAIFLNVGIAECAAASRSCYKRVQAVDRLHVHWLPDGTTLGIIGA